MSTAFSAIVMGTRTRKMMFPKQARKPLGGGLLKARKRPPPVLALLQRKKRKKSKEAIRKAEVLAAKVEVAEVLQNKRRSVSLVDHLQFPVIRVML